MIRTRLTTDARRDLTELLGFIQEQPWGNPRARRAEIVAGIDSLVFTPEVWPCWRMKRGKIYRLLIVKKRFLVPYIYYPPIPRRHQGIISVRAIRHGLQQFPLQGVREEPRYPYNAEPGRDGVPYRSDVRETPAS